MTDYTNASRTMLYNIRTLCWDEDICNVRSIFPCAMLPEVRPIERGSTAMPTSAGRRCPIAGIAGDQQAALFGQACFEEGRCKKHLWHRLLSADEHRRTTLCRSQKRAC